MCIGRWDSRNFAGLAAVVRLSQLHYLEAGRIFRFVMQDGPAEYAILYNLKRIVYVALIRLNGILHE
jgi:hypothetical protein